MFLLLLDIFLKQGRTL